jgi:hypothetical protein
VRVVVHVRLTGERPFLFGEHDGPVIEAAGRKPTWSGISDYGRCHLFTMDGSEVADFANRLSGLDSKQYEVALGMDR